MRAVNHEVSRSIIGFAEGAGCPVIAVERLEGIRSHRLRKGQWREIHRWAYGQLMVFLRYKAEERGMAVIEVDAKGTSQGCSCCGRVAAANRIRHAFVRGACGYAQRADLNAARDIRLRGILFRQVLEEGGRPSCRPEARPDDLGSNPSERTGKPLLLLAVHDLVNLLGGLRAEFSM